MKWQAYFLLEDNVHEMSSPICWKKWQNHKISSAEIFTQYTKR